MGEKNIQRESTRQYINFMLAGEEYGAPIEEVREIIRHRPLTRIPHSAPGVVGVLNLRGVVIPVYDLRERFGLPGAETTASTRVVVIQQECYTLGYIVDAVTEVLMVDGDSISPPPPGGQTIGRDHIAGMARHEDRLIILLNLDGIFRRPEAEAVPAAME